MQNLTLLFGRLGLSLIFILSGVARLMAWGDSGRLLVGHGLPPGLLPLIVFVELAGGLAVLCGLLTRWAAIGLFAFTLLTAIVLHDNLADHAQWVDFMKNIAIAGGFLVLAVRGPGDFSLDAWRARRKQKQKIFL